MATHAIALEPDTLAIFVRKISTNAHEIHVRMAVFATTIMDLIRANANQDSVALTVNRSSTSVSHLHASMEELASRLKKVTLSAFVEKVLRDNFVK
jgi:uncharacterized membrane protein